MSKLAGIGGARALIAHGILFAIAGFAIWYNYALPVYHYESFDRGFSEIEVPWKGRDFALVEAHFNEYKKWKGDPNITLCRTSKPIWSVPRLWRENFTHPRWNLEYIPPSPEPADDWRLAGIRERKPATAAGG